MSGRAVSTIEGHAAAIKRTVRNSRTMRKTPTIPYRGPMPFADNSGMAIAVDMLFNSLSAKPRMSGEAFIQFDSMRRARATFSSAWESSPAGISEGSTFTSGGTNIKVTNCPTQQRWFGLFLRGAESRMGYSSQRNQPLGIGVVAKMLQLVLEEVDDQEKHVAREYMKFGAAAALAVCASLRGNEVFLLDLAGMWRYIEIGREGTMPEDPMKIGGDLTKAPHIIVTLIGQFKGELGTRHHLIALGSETSSGIKLRWWLEELLRIREEEGCRTGPAFGARDGSVGLMSEYDDLLRFFLQKTQAAFPDSILPSDDIDANYGFSRTFRRTAEGRARAANLDSGVQNAMNRWRTIEEAKGKRPRFSMVDHYSHAQELMSVTWRYSFVQ